MGEEVRISGRILSHKRIEQDIAILVSMSDGYVEWREPIIVVCLACPPPLPELRLQLTGIVVGRDYYDDILAPVVFTSNGYMYR